MQILVKNVKLPYYVDFDSAIDDILSKKGIKGVEWKRIFKKSLDARKKPDIYFVYTILCQASQYPRTDKDIELYLEENFIENIRPRRKFTTSPVVVGFGPCGMFCGLILSRFGYKPLILERGSDIDRRRQITTNFFQGKGLDTQCNIQFGEGGAGTFSDGKLITRIKDKKSAFVMRELVRHGAPKEILYQAKPHLGTDNLAKIVKSIREEIIALGGKVMFDSCVCNIEKRTDGYEIILKNGEKIFCPAVFLASGHSAYDVYEMLMNKGFSVVAKDFSVGMRVEHLQQDVDFSLYGNQCCSANAHLLPKGEYSLSYRKGDRGVYSFCMCPGGQVVASASEENTIVTNGMSNYKRDGINANSAICISVLKEDYGATPMGAMQYRQRLEKAAFTLGGGKYKAPCQTVGGFLDKKGNCNFSKVIPSYSMGVEQGDLSKLFTAQQNELFCQAMRKFGSQYSFFADMSAVLTGVETRTSSPCRIERGENLCAMGYDDFYPCGEGAGYAGGITSAALDGIRCAVEYITKE